MFSAIKGWLTQLTTGKDNQTPCTARIMGVLSFIYANVMQGWEVIVNHSHFSLQDYGIGIGALFTTIGIFIGLKSKDEPEVK